MTTDTASPNPHPDPGTHRQVRGGSGPGLRWRLLGAMALIVLAGAGTLFLVAFLVAPSVFYAHLADAGLTPTGPAAAHLNTGFTTALVLGIAGGVAAAALVAVAVAFLVARRIADPLTGMADTATRLAGGDYSVRVQPPGMGPELADLAAAVNSLAERLEATATARLRLLQDLRHELRTPLTSLQATVEAITDGVLPADEDTLATLTDQTQRLLRLVDDLDAVSRADEHAFQVTLQPVDLAATARTAAQAVTARYTAAQIALAPPPGAAAVHAVADPERVAEILDQLLDNALKNGRPGDTVTLTTGRDPDGCPFVAVTDTGRGFPPDQTDALFDRFHRHDPLTSTGTGIGLTIARSLATAMHGTLTAASAGVDRGAAFRLTLPAPPAGHGTQPATAADAGGGRPGAAESTRGDTPNT